MSIQIRGCEYTCQKCSKEYIPLHDKYPCPACNSINNIQKDEVYFNFVDEVVGAMYLYKNRFDKFTPNSIYINGISGNLCYFICKTFDRIERFELDYTTDMFHEEMVSYFGKEYEYIIPNLKDIIDQIHTLYKKQDQFKSKKPPSYETFTGFFKTLIP